MVAQTSFPSLPKELSRHTAAANEEGVSGHIHVVLLDGKHAQLTIPLLAETEQQPSPPPTLPPPTPPSTPHKAAPPPPATAFTGQAASTRLQQPRRRIPPAAKTLLVVCLVVLAQILTFLALGHSWPRLRLLLWSSTSSSSASPSPLTHPPRTTTTTSYTATATSKPAIPCPHSVANWTLTPLGEFARSSSRNSVSVGAGLSRLASPFEPVVDGAALGLLPSRNHFSTCSSIFEDPFRPTGAAGASPYGGNGPGGVPLRGGSPPRYADVQAAGGSSSVARYPEKFFREAFADSHQDARFGPQPGSRRWRRPVFGGATAAASGGAGQVSAALSGLIGAWSRFSAAANVTAWLAHGTLMGWWWAGELLPWDDDLDLQMTLHDLEALAERLPPSSTSPRASFRASSSSSSSSPSNSSSTPSSSTSSALPALFESRYLLEVNPSHIHRWRETANIIDARFIDTTTGRFLDITALASAADRGAALASASFPLFVRCKSQHVYAYDDLFPLRRTTFEGVEVLVPFDVAAVLAAEYGVASTTRTWFKGHFFNATAGRWVPAPPPPPPPARQGIPPPWRGQSQPPSPLPPPPPQKGRLQLQQSWPELLAAKANAAGVASGGGGSGGDGNGGDTNGSWQQQQQQQKQREQKGAEAAAGGVGSKKPPMAAAAGAAEAGYA